MIRSIRVDHTIFLQVPFKTHSFIPCRQIYESDPIIFMSVTVNTSGHVYDDFVRLIFLMCTVRLAFYPTNYLRWENICHYIPHNPLHHFLCVLNIHKPTDFIASKSKRRESGGKCNTRTMMHREGDTTFKMDDHHVTLKKIVEEIRLEKE